MENYNNLIEFINDVRFEQRFLNTLTGAQGGFLVPEGIHAEVARVAREGAIVRPKALVIPADPAAPDVPTSLPLLKQGALGITGNVVAQWSEEGQPVPEVEATMSELRLVPHDLVTQYTVTDKLLRNSVNNVFLNQMLGETIREAEDEAFLVGDGINQPQGIINCPGRIDVQRTLAGHIAYADIVTMISKLTPSSLMHAQFIAETSMFIELMSMTDAGGTLIPLINFRREDGTFYLAEIPLVFTDKLPSLADRGCLVLADLRCYAIKDGFGPAVKASATASMFGQNKTQIKMTFAVDGAGIVAEPLTSKNGDLVSPFVVLD